MSPDQIKHFRKGLSVDAFRNYRKLNEKDKETIKEFQQAKKAKKESKKQSKSKTKTKNSKKKQMP